MVGLTIIIIILGVLVYLSATKTPFREKDEPAPSGLSAPDQKVSPEEGSQNAGKGVAKEQTPEEENSNVIATVTFKDSQTPEKQIQQTAGDGINLQNDEALYTIRMRSSWNKLLHPHWHPDGSHLSPMVAWTHYLKNVLFRETNTASKGMEIMAETGATPEIVKEIKTLTTAGIIFSHNTDIGPLFTPGEKEIQIKTAKTAPYVTVVSMIAPSPDWFITARNIKLYENGRWLERLSIPAILYDAGTDSGTTFTAEDEDTNPKQPIIKLRNPPAIPIATFEFVRN